MNKSTTIFHGLYSCRPEKWRQNVQISSETTSRRRKVSLQRFGAGSLRDSDPYGYPRYFHVRIFPGPQTSLIIGFWIRIWVSEGFETKGMLGQPQTLWEVYFNVVYHAAVFVLSRKWRDEEGGRHCMTRQKRLCRRLSLIHHLRNEEETGTSSLLQRPVGWLLGTRYSSIGQFFPPVPSNNPRSLCKS